jgi:hypothetical protein
MTIEVHSKYFIRRKFFVPKNESERYYGPTISDESEQIKDYIEEE